MAGSAPHPQRDGLILLIAAAFAAGGCDGGGSSATASASTTNSSSQGGGGTGGAPTTTMSSGGSGGAGGAGGVGGAAFPTVSCDAPTGALPPLGLTRVADGFDQPLGIEFAPGDDERMFVLEKTGRVRVVENGVLLDAPFLDLSDVVWTDSEAGLLALAFHPDYAINGRFFVYYLQYINDGAHLQEFRRSADDPNRADPTPVGDPMLAVLHAHIHNGGALEFSPVDGLLYFSLGERGNGVSAQALDTPYGKILRLDVSQRPYAIPPGNAPGGLPEIWDFGLRNPWRMAFDACSGVLYIGDVGEFAQEEIDIEEPGDGGHNYGWPLLEGNACHPEPCDPTGLTPPLVSLSHGPPDDFHVVIGGEVYRGHAIPALRGTYVFADTFGGVFGLRYAAGTVSERIQLSLGLEPLIAPVAFGRDHHGELYVADYQAGAVLGLVVR